MGEGRRKAKKSGIRLRSGRSKRANDRRRTVELTLRERRIQWELNLPAEGCWHCVDLRVGARKRRFKRRRSLNVDEESCGCGKQLSALAFR